MKKKTSVKKVEPKYSPTLNTVIMVENTLKNMNDSVFKVSAIKKELPKQVNHNTLMNILEYLENSNKIYVGLKGITWVYNTNPKLQEDIKKGTKLWIKN